MAPTLRQYAKSRGFLFPHMIFWSNATLRKQVNTQRTDKRIKTSAAVEGDIFVNENENKNENYLQNENHSAVDTDCWTSRKLSFVRYSLTCFDNKNLALSKASTWKASVTFSCYIPQVYIVCSAVCVQV